MWNIKINKQKAIRLNIERKNSYCALSDYWKQVGCHSLINTD